MRRVKRFQPLLLALALLITGCVMTSLSEANAQENPRPEDSATTPDEAQTGSDSDALECNWILEVDDTLEKESNGVEYTYHLVLLLEKKGGTNKQGAYIGKLYLKTEQGIASIQDEVFEDEAALTGTSFIESHADTVTINVASFAGDVFAQFDFTKDSPDSPLAPLAPLGEYDAMALERPELSHRQQYDVGITFEDGDSGNLSKDKVYNSPITMKMLIIGADVFVYLPSLNLHEAFKGTITGIPVF